jgi:hypothetical protein
MSKTRTAIPESLKREIIARSNNRCCICQVPFINIHHLDENPSNNHPDNLAPLCPNCHNQAHQTGNMTVRLSPERIKALRERWYAYCDKRRDVTNISPNAILKLKNFVRSSPLAQYGWAKTFGSIDPAYKSMSRDDIIDHLFATSNRDDLVTYLETVKAMYQVSPHNEEQLSRFEAVCSAFGVGYDELG